MMCGTAAEIKEREMHGLLVFLALLAKDPELVAGCRYFHRRRRATTCLCAS